MKVSIKRIRREFGEPLSFGDRNVGDVKDGAVECSGYEDKTFELDRIELDKSVQVCNDHLLKLKCMMTLYKNNCIL